MKDILEQLIQKKELSHQQMSRVMHDIMQGKMDEITLSAFLIALSSKGETVNELTEAAKVMSQYAKHLSIENDFLVDVVGTGGDGFNTFNISTASAFIAAACGVVIAKHGNRSASSPFGSADIIEALGINLSLSEKQIINCIEKINLCFLYAPNYHPAMRHAKNVRKKLKLKTIFNLLGPLTNPCHAKKQLIGVYSKRWLRPITEAFKSLGSNHTLVVHAKDGLDELSVFSTNYVCELKSNEILEYTIHPDEFHLAHENMKDIQVKDGHESLEMILSLLKGEKGAHRDIAILNAGATIYCAGLADDIKTGVHFAQNALDSGKAYEKLQQLRALTNET